MREKAGRRPPRTRVPKGEPAAYWTCNRQYEAAGKDKKALYLLVGTHLALAEGLLEQEENPDEPMPEVDLPAVRRSGLGVVLMTVMCAQQRLKENDLAAAICDGWLMPNLGHAQTNPQKIMSRCRLLTFAVTSYSQAKQYDRMLAAARLALPVSPDLNTKDATRVQIAKAHRGLAQYDEAIATLEEITHESMLGARKLIPQLEKQRDAKPKDAK